MKKNYINVWVEHRIPTLDALTYQCDFYVEKGMRVIVPLQSKNVVGLVCELNVSYDQEKPIKHIVKVVDETPIFSDAQFELVEYIKNMSVSDSISVVKAMLPSHLKPTIKKQRIAKERFVICKQQHDHLTTRQHEIVNYVKANQPLAYRDYRKYAKGLAKKLVDDNVVKVIEKDKQYSLLKDVKKEPFLQLNKDQQTVYEQIKRNEFNTYLLFGITGSGKTEVFMHLVRDTLAQGKNVLVLVPEVALTPQMIDRFLKRFDENIVVYHSHLSDNERFFQYNQVKNNQAHIVIGTRSAIFLPMDNIGCIIMDEEHDGSFKQEVSPYYHVRDIADFLCKKHQCPLLLASATPSLESYARALKGVYHLLQLKDRINKSLATIEVVNMKQSIQDNKNLFLSEQLLSKIEDRLQKKEQIILLLNRRGYTPHVMCKQCLSMATCHYCDVLLTYHIEDKKLHCHNCNHVYHQYQCQQCNHTQFMGSGIATQRLEEVLKKRFNQARVLRLDYDTTKVKNAHEILLNSFNKHEYDILIGTQMVAKGLDIPNVTLVGILQADVGLSRNDFHVNESTYAMISQAAGRSGRHDKKGEVIIQAFNSEHYVIKAAYHQDYTMFFKQEMHYRKLAILPPYVYLISLIITHRNKEKAYTLGYDLFDALKEKESMVLGVSDLGKSKDHFRYQIVIKTKTLSKAIENVKMILREHKQLKPVVSVNVSPNHLE